MIKTINKFILFLILVFIYELSIVIFKLDGVSISKIVVTSFLWLSVGLVIHTFVKNYRKFRDSIPRFSFYIFWLLIIWNSINIFRGLYSESGSLTTVLGNTYNTLALLLPFVIVFSIKIVNIKIIKPYFFILLRIGIILFILFFIFGQGVLNDTQIKILNLFFLPVVFLITIIYFERKKFIILLAVVLLFYVAYVNSSRTMIIRELLLIIGLIQLYFYRKFHFRWILKGTFILLFVPLIFIQNSMNTGESVIKKTIGSVSDNELSNDTRTFLYLEVYQDLAENNQLLFGKGSDGTYYSEYFNEAKGSSSFRHTAEVGVLAILLKSGLIGVLLYLLLLFSAIYYALFRSHNYYVVGIGLMLFIYTQILFIENLISYSSHNIYVWFFIGICLSKQMRNMSNLEFKIFLNHKNKLH